MTSPSAQLSRHRAWLLAVAILLGLVVLAVLVTGPWRSLAGGSHGEERRDLGAQIEAWAAVGEPGDRLALADIAAFDWDRVAVLPPYTTNKLAEAALGFGWDAEATRIDVDDSVNLLAFARGDAVVAWTLVGRRAELPPGQSGHALTLSRDEAILTWSGSAFSVAR